MNCNQWTLGLAAAGVISLGAVAQAEEAPSHVITKLSQTRLGGYVDTSAIWKFGTSEGRPLPGRSFDGADRQDGFNFNVAKVSLSRPLDETDWAAGYQLDLLFGPDASGYNPTVSGGRVNAGNDVGVKRAYVAVRAPVGNGIDFKIGTFDTIIGYEVFESPNNPNYSRSYAWGLEPTQHTGVLASYQVNEVLGIAFGVANTINEGINGRPWEQTVGQAWAGGAFARPARMTRPASESRKTYMVAVTIEIPEDMFLGGTAFYLGAVNGLNNVLGPTTADDITNLYAGATIPTPLEKLTVGLAWDYAMSKFYKPQMGPGWPAARYIKDDSDMYAWAASIYLSYQATERLALHTRTEYTQASRGVYTPISQDDNDQFLGVTATADYKIWDNVISRLELRYDVDVSSDPKAFAQRPDGGSGDKSSVSLALNMIYQF